MKESLKLTGIKATWTGGPVEAKSEIDKNKVKVEAIYDDGSTKEINTKEKQAVVKNTVKYVEQVFSDLEGCEKLEKAKATAKQAVEAMIKLTEVTGRPV